MKLESMTKEVSEVLEWLESNGTASTDEYKKKKEEFQEKMQPLILGTKGPDIDSVD